MVVRSLIPSLARLLQNSPGLQKITVNTISYRGIPVFFFYDEPLFFMFNNNYLRVVTVMCVLWQSYIVELDIGFHSLLEHSFCYSLQDAEFNRHLRKQGLNPDGCWRLEYGDFPTTKQTYSPCVVAKRAKSKHVVSFIKLVLQNSKAVDTVVLRLGGYLNATEYEKLLRMVPTFTRNKNVRTRGQAKRLLNVLKITPRTVCV